MNDKITIINYQMGNLLSVAKKVKQLGVDYEITSNPQDILKAKKIILPGVGHFGMAMENLNKLNLIYALDEAVLENKIPVLGICLGMQLMAKRSEEGNVEGLGWFDAEVKKLIVSDTIKYKIPHIGWNTVSLSKDSRLMTDISNESEFYFVHAYHVQCHDAKDVLNTTIYDKAFVSAIEKENIFGVQYHPEKSHAEGQKLFVNFIKL
jgi:glutamine amidotransferase